MGIFDFLRKSNPPAGGASSDKKIAGLAKVVADKRAQTYDRLDAIQSLAAMKSADAAAALLRRFPFSIDPSITDQEEKDLAFRGIVDAGRDAVPAVVEFCLKAEALTWPLKILRELLDEADYRAELVRLLDRFDTEYARNTEPKQQLIVALCDIKGDDVRIAVERFLEDVNETVRFHAVQTIFSQGDEVSTPALVKMLATEESVRVKNKVAEGLMGRGWTVPADLRSGANQALQDSNGFSVGPDGKLRKGAGYG
ncbi:HEAT repeat domain-containing protein [Sorangium sp. So ce1151]|uniref:HEAT repeat domain-containing protein n=1 Tax=Sorangium sp. So ce1151 TaxID=3133332 RepID=UPI003F5DEBAE